VVLSYRYCKFIKLPSCVGIVGENWHCERSLRKGIKFNSIYKSITVIFTSVADLLSSQVVLELSHKVGY